MKSLARSLTLLLAIAGSLAAQPATSQVDLTPGAERLWGGSTAEAKAAEAGLRAAGPAGMEAALRAADVCQGTGCADPAALARLDRLCGVRDCRDIRLFWYTDLDQAKAAASAARKPILSLRLLGRLDEEMSCANSRFFRTALYPNRAIGELLRRDFVLHWQSLREVPKVTIDFGNGRKLEQTVTGNSVHYLLDSHGRLLDVLPGLYGPATFRRNLELARDDAARADRLDDEAFARWATQRHTSTLMSLDRALKAVRAAPGSVGRRAVSRNAASRDAWQAPKSQPAPPARDTASKAFIEVGLLRALDQPLEATNEEIERVAALTLAKVKLDEVSREFLARKHGVVEPLARQRLVEGFERTMAADEVLNEYRYRRAALRRLIAEAGVPALGLEAFNEWLYESLFEAPIRDPWMGLMPTDVYAALPPPPPPILEDNRKL